MQQARKESQGELQAVAAKLLGKPVESVSHAGAGGNSRIYRVRAQGQDYALKMYPTITGDKRDRLGVEKKALQFFAQYGLTNVPRWVADGEGYALLSWVEGELANPPQEREIDEAGAFLAAIKNLSGRPEANALPPASEACASGAEVLRQIEKRLAKLQEVKATEPALAAFLDTQFLPMLDTMTKRARELYQTQGVDFESDKIAKRCLIPADFGFHNAMRSAEGKLTFIDFEYFGWDDPTKLVADFLLHPAMPLTANQRQRFHALMLNAFADDAHFAPRLSALTPLFALRWVLILLNEFLPERWRGRAFAKGENEWEAARSRQLAKASGMLAQLNEGTFDA